MKKFLLLFFAFILNACTYMVNHELDLTVLKDGKPLQNYEVTIKRLEESAIMSSSTSGMTDDEILWTLGAFKTDANGNINVKHSYFTDNRKLTGKPMFFISSKDINSCYIVPWYIEKKNFFVPMIFKDGKIADAIKNPDDMTGNFEFKGGWKVNATIHNMSNICTP